MAVNKMVDRQRGGKLIDTKTFLTQTKRKAKLYEDMQTLLKEQNESAKRNKPKKLAMFQRAVRLVMSLNNAKRRSSNLLKPSIVPKFTSAPVFGYKHTSNRTNTDS